MNHSDFLDSFRQCVSDQIPPLFQRFHNSSLKEILQLCFFDG